MKLLTPMARTLPSASSVSRARYASRVRSNADGSAWCRISRSIWSTPSLRGALVEAVQGLVVAVVADPDLGLQEDVGPVEARAVDRLTDLALVAVGGGGVDVAVAAARAASTASRVSSGGVWKTPKPSAGISTPLLRVSDSMPSTFPVRAVGNPVMFRSARSVAVPYSPGKCSVAAEWSPMPLRTMSR